MTYITTTHNEARRIYNDDLRTHVNPGILEACPANMAAAVVDDVDVAANQYLFSALWSALDAKQQDLVTVRRLFNVICSDEIN